MIRIGTVCFVLDGNELCIPVFALLEDPRIRRPEDTSLRRPEPEPEPWLDWQLNGRQVTAIEDLVKLGAMEAIAQSSDGELRAGFLRRVASAIGRLPAGAVRFEVGAAHRHT